MNYFYDDTYMSQFVNGVCDNFGLAPRAVISILAIVLLWSTFWKLFSMWKSARKGSIIWFIVIALTNTIGILPILYIYVFSKINWKKTSKSKVKNSKKKSRAKKKSNKKRR